MKSNMIVKSSKVKLTGKSQKSRQLYFSVQTRISANCYAFAVFVTLSPLIIRRYGFAANNTAVAVKTKLLHNYTADGATGACLD